MPPEPLARPVKGLKLPSDRRTLPPTVQAIVFLLLFRAAIGFCSTLWSVWTSPQWETGPRIGFSVFMLLVGVGSTAILVAIVVRGSVISPYLLTVLGVLGLQNVFYLTMVDVVVTAASVLLVVFAWSPSSRAFIRRMRDARRREPRLPYRYDGPRPKKDDFLTGG